MIIRWGPGAEEVRLAVECLGRISAALQDKHNVPGDMLGAEESSGAESGSLSDQTSLYPYLTETMGTESPEESSHKRKRKVLLSLC